MVAAHVGLRSW